ncbi:AzlD domain-containing protein [Pseudonocardia pini]|uniref:AzlD domain-containing protein n=1 Tax=Pseudonocardia pini TaxID=2758030 RepID=UPI0015F0167C|nr:AzlD domain-containing protein [Pseudonocardia pini]
MSALLALFGGAAATYLLRVLLVAVVPADKLPAWVREALPHVGPAVLAALIVGSLVHQGGIPALFTAGPAPFALLAAGFVAWRFRSLAAPMAAALLVMLAATPF